MSRSMYALLLVACLAFLLPGLARAEDKPASEADAALQQMLKELRAEAVKIRGLEWKREVPGAMIARKDIPAALLAELDALLPKAERDEVTRVFRRMGMLAEDEDPFALIATSFAGLIGGFYSPWKKRLYIVEGLAGDAQRPVILHELVHALEDQHFDFESRTLPIAFDMDRSFAVSCVIEGSAEHSRVLYQSTHRDIAALYMRESTAPARMREQFNSLQSVPAFLIVPMMITYRHGPLLVARTLRESEGKDYEAVAAELYTAGPVSAEQILHPDRWFTDKKDYPRSVAWAGDLGWAAGKGWRVARELRMGELDLALYLDFFLAGNGGKVIPMNLARPVPAVAEARNAAAGWDAGRLMFLEKKGCPLAVVQAWCFDSAKHADEAGAALLKALRATHGDAWKAKDWKAVAAGPGEPFESRTLSYEGKHGPGRIAIRNDQVLIVDGAPKDTFERVWTWTLKTRFHKDDRDKWVEPAPDAPSEPGK